jgi:hypothetical protein
MSPDPTGRAQDVILDDSGNPFASKAKAMAKANELKLDASVYAIVKQGSGWVIVKRESATFDVADKLDAEPAPNAKKKADTERYFVVRFHSKQNASETRDVEACVNGEVLIMQRERNTILPERFVRHLALCRYPDERQMPGQPRKTVGWIQTYPFTVIREATKAEFDKQRREGTEATRKQFEDEAVAPDFEAGQINADNPIPAAMGG